jgi:hypothetical protein
MTAKRFAVVLALFSAISLLLSCSSGPSAPEKGTPAFYWQSAREVYAAGDYMKTLQHLDNLLATENEYTARALPWVLVMKAGIAAGYMEAAESYNIGAHNNKTDPLAFRRVVSEYRDSAGQLALQFAEDFGKLDKLKGETVTLEFAYPKGTAAPVAQFTKVSTGIALTPAEAETAQQRALERGVLLAACRAAGAANDTARTEELLKTGVATVPRATFLEDMAESLFQLSQLYVSDKLDQPQKEEALIQRAQTALAGVPESKETKELNGKMQAALKKLKK